MSPNEHDEALEKIIKRFSKGWPAYIGVGPGWFPIIIELDERLAEIDPDYEIHQIKEKFGGLRYYIESGTEEMDRLIFEAEDLSYKTCEETGKPGKLLSKHGWLKTLSPEDFPDYEPVEQG